jgi:uncharacterized protein YndB with AHSA1/START domain
MSPAIATARAAGPDYTRRFTTTATPEQVFAAVTNPRGWWDGEHEGSAAKLGDTFTYRYSDIHYSKQEVVELVPNRRVAWRVLDSRLNFIADKSEWTGTTITFDIIPKGELTELVFTHVGLVPDIECYDTCTDAWGSLIGGALKTFIETGKSIPTFSR